jgi:antitoxin ParD1/3/4
MDDHTISISVSDEEQAFIAAEIAAGRYASEREVLRAGLAVLEHETKLRELRTLIAEGDADFERGDYMTFNEPGELTQYIVDNAADLK